jgi:hypothetical protein
MRWTRTVSAVYKENAGGGGSTPRPFPSELQRGIVAEWIVVVDRSPFHSLTPKKANKQPKLVLTLVSTVNILAMK